ncbi:leucine--tRNA ligase [Flavilitoribacter nigricans]|uniref:Leucine--tRNA ligase n=1 Tax=Flavilitoribacter nigricans (strain ATCC 23147 / DSM 23189 / NBRC 102662 / NCIMB 1420 / SS-2) TaxID=1122177 RepID=A0A2D0N7I9_FLAN2|nr:class I tRNA ligase family protein [Flavilitoribacter nigricans]PHN04455.1 leucine--tRNA ligase [Flavilitoribacter nigricans DSM 23189 = NBRC 102662]
MDYQPRDIEKKWKKFWEDQKVYRVETPAAGEQDARPKFYVLDMFPYPSGAGLHVGHPLGYIASDIFARYKRLKGFNVLHPMGYDSFGLPAEQYAIQTGIHPAVSTDKNIQRFREQLENMGFSFDWSREIRTSDPKYYRWTQWIFMQLFNHYYDQEADKALPIEQLIERLAREGNAAVKAACDDDTPVISAADWNAMSEEQQQLFLLQYRLTFPKESYVNWCAALGTVLSNDEVKDGVSERGGYPVERKLMKQWSMRITAYADRLLYGLDNIDWPESLKEQQRNWIGRSQGASVRFPLENDPGTKIEVFTTRVDTIYGVTFMCLAPEHDLVSEITTPEQQDEIDQYIKWAASRSEVERMAEVKTVTGAFTGSYCINPFNDEKVPIYIADYVLAGYGTGAVMAVPSGDQRDWNFATHFGLPIRPILDAQENIDEAADATKEGKYINSGMINGLTYDEAVPKLIAWLEEKGLGKGKIQYRIRDAIFGRQRYWGEPVPVYWNGEVPYLIEESELPLLLPPVDKYLPTETGEPPLARAENWKYQDQYEYELSTMPGWAGSSWYWYRYMDPGNTDTFASKEAINYWKDVDLYVGGSEHATGHLLYSRFWNHFLYDLGLVPEKEFAKKLINQGMIQGVIEFIHLIKTEEDDATRTFISADLLENYPDTEFALIPVHVDFVSDYGKDTSHLTAEGIGQFKDWRPDYKEAEFIANDAGQLVTRSEVGKMSKRYFNVVNPDDVVERYGADCFRMYEMFLGPIEQAKPWDMQGIDGVYRFLRKFWNLFFNNKEQFAVTDDAPTKEELKILHTAIKKVNEDIERFSFNTCVPAFMVATNDLGKLNAPKRAILQDLVVLIAPFAPYIAEEMWHRLGNEGSVHKATYPEANEEYLKEDSITYPIAINGKTKITVDFPADAKKDELETSVLGMENVQKYIADKTVRKVIVVPGRMINIVAN